MKKVRIPLTLAAALIAGVAVVGTANSSARYANFTFVKKASAPIQSTLRTDYVFKASSGLCDVKPDEICKAVWTQTSPAVENQPPSLTAVITTSRTPGQSQLVP